jgi:hypothetical protein
MSKPEHESDEMCPLFKSKRRLVCHKCAWYIHVRGMHPQTGEELDKWECSIVMQPILMIENSRQQHVNAAAITSLRNEVVEGNNKRITADLIRTQALLRARNQT